jgi:hypothetical protein
MLRAFEPETTQGMGQPMPLPLLQVSQHTPPRWAHVTFLLPQSGSSYGGVSEPSLCPWPPSHKLKHPREVRQRVTLSFN